MEDHGRTAEAPPCKGADQQRTKVFCDFSPTQHEGSQGQASHVGVACRIERSDRDLSEAAVGVGAMGAPALLNAQDPLGIMFPSWSPDELRVSVWCFNLL